MKSQTKKINNRAHFNYYDSFANKNWMPSKHEDDSSIDFFSIPDYAVTILEGKNKVSQLFVYMRKVSIENNDITIAGIGDVVTHINFRRKGYGVELLNQALEFISDKADFALLCTDIDKLGNFYRLAGFKPLKKTYYFMDKFGFEKTESGGMYMRLSDCPEIDNILNPDIKLHVGRSNF